jgi:tetratricopeptide (TPR) repeat protein
MLAISLGIGILFWLFHGISLVMLARFVPKNQNDVITQVNGIGSLLSKFYIYIFLIFLVLGYLLPDDWPTRRKSKSGIGIVVAPIAVVLILAIVLFSNLRVIYADITFKMAEPFANSSQWQVATFLYKRALELAPKEDHYYLFLGRSYLETAKQTSAVADQDQLVLQAESDLQVAQSINPLNTDHTANLARLYTWWAGKAAANSDARSQRAQKASNYYSTAVKLSPNNSTLWDEWSILYSQLLGQYDLAYQKLQQALSLDPKYNYTQGLIGDYYVRLASSADNLAARQQDLLTAAQYYRTAADVTKYTDTNTKATYLVTLANTYDLLANLNTGSVDITYYQQAIDILNQYIEAGLSSKDLWQVQETIAKVYLKLGDKTNAQYYASLALEKAPASAVNRIQSLITQTLTLP